MIYKALPPGGAFSIYSEAGIDCQPKTRKILGILLFYIFYEYIEWKCWKGRAGEKGRRVWSGLWVWKRLPKEPSNNQFMLLLEVHIIRCWCIKI